MSTNQSLALIGEVPEYLRAAAEAARQANVSALGGIKAGGFPRISIGGSKFHVIEGDTTTLLTDPNNPELPAMQLEIVVVGFNAAVSKTYYEGKWQPGDADEPTCSSDNGAVPDPGVPGKQSDSCAQCPQNVWGSRITEQGKQTKACSDNKRLVVKPVSDLEGRAISFTITPASLKPWAEYVRALDSKGIGVGVCVTKVQFDPTVTFPKLVFKFGRYLTAEELAKVQEAEKSDEVRLIASPRQSIPIAHAPVSTSVTPPVGPAPAPAPVAPPAAPAAPVAPPAAPAAPAAWTVGLAPEIVAAITAVGGPDSVPGKAMIAQFKPAAPAPADPYEGLPAHVKVAVEAAGGLQSPGGAATYKALGGTADLTQPAAPAPAPAPKPVDPYEGLPAHVKPAVDASGGLDTPAGQSVYKALAGKDAPGATTAPAPAPAAPAKRGRKPAAPATPPAQPPAPAAPPAATPPAPQQPTGFASAPAAGLGADIDALLAQAMSTPTK